VTAADDADYIAVRLCTAHQATSPTRLPCAATQEVDALVAAARSEVTRENADLLIGMWHNMEFSHPHKDGMRQASSILYWVAHAASPGEPRA
jgi:hypothetical protein